MQAELSDNLLKMGHDGAMKQKTTPIGLAASAEIRSELGVLHMTWPDLARKSGVPYRTLYTYLNDERDMPVGTMRAVSEALGIKLLDLVDRAEQRLEKS